MGWKAPLREILLLQSIASKTLIRKVLKADGNKLAEGRQQSSGAASRRNGWALGRNQCKTWKKQQTIRLFSLS